MTPPSSIPAPSPVRSPSSPDPKHPVAREVGRIVLRTIFFYLLLLAILLLWRGTGLFIYEGF